MKMKNLIYVRFQYENQHPRYQIFQEIDREVYYGRDHFLLWHTICMENHQMVLEMVVPNEFVFIICDDRNQEVLRSSNQDYPAAFPLLRYRCLSEWADIRENYDVSYENDFPALLDKDKQSGPVTWLLSLKKNYEAANPLTAYEEKLWLTNCKDIQEPELLHTFDYCGTKIRIYRIQKQHSICKMRWYEYYSGQVFVGFQALSEEDSGANT